MTNGAITASRPAAARRGSGVGLALGLLSAASFGTSGSFARSLTTIGWSAEAAVAVRVGIGALVLAIPAALALRGRWSVLRRSLGTIGRYGLLAVVAAQVCFFNAIQHVPVGVALLLEYSGVILVAGWMWAVHGERPRRLTVAGAVAAIAGLVLVVGVSGGGASIDVVGVLWGLGAAVGLAAYYVLSAHIDEELPSVALACGGMGVGAAILVVLGLVGLIPFDAVSGDVVLFDRSVSWLVPVVGLSVVAAALAYLSGIGAARILGPHLSSFLGLTEVLFAIAFAWMALGELPTAMQVAGGVLIVAGIALVRLDGLRDDRDEVPIDSPIPPEPEVSGAAH